MSSRTLTIAQNDISRTLRSRVLWAIYLLVFLLTIPSTWNYVGDRYFELQYLGLIPWNNRVYSMLLAGVIAYASIAGERESGTLRLVVSLAGTRRDALLGKVLSRTAVVLVVLVPILGLMNVALYLQQGSLYPKTYIPIALWSLLYAVCWTGFSVGMSAAFASRYRALGAIGGTYLLLSPSTGLWSTVVHPTLATLFTGSTSAFDEVGTGSAPMWAQYAERLNPILAYTNGGQWISSTTASAEPITGVLPNLFGLCVLGCFGFAPVLFGYKRFSQADFGGHSTDGLSNGRYWHTAWDYFRQGRILKADTSIVSKEKEHSTKSRVKSIARVDFIRTVQSRLLWVIVPLFLVITITSTGNRVGNQPAEAIGIRGVFIVLLAGIVAYTAIAGERESGTLRFLLGLVGTRRDAIIGKVMSRTAVTCIVLVPIILVFGVNIYLQQGSLHLPTYIIVSLWAFLYATVCTCFAIGLSAAFSSRYRTLVAIGGTYLFFSPIAGLWENIGQAFFSFVFTGDFGTNEFIAIGSPTTPAWIQYTGRLSPPVAYSLGREWLVSVVGPAEQMMGTLPNLFGICVLLLFGSLPFLFGYKRLQQADLG